MSDDVQQQLAAAAQAMSQLDVTTRRCSDLRSREGDLTAELNTLRAGYDAEEKDVTRLEGVSLTRVLVSLHGARDDALAKERAEADAARYRVTDAESRLKAVQAELETAQGQATELAGAPDAYAAALAAKEQYLTGSGDPRASQLMQLAEERGRLEGELKEIHEADQTAVNAQRALSDVQDKLGSASSWSTYDTYFGGGMLASAVKHSRLDEAAQLAAEADRCLALLRTELANADELAPQMAVSGATRFVDIWFNNIFSDFAFQDRVRQAQQNVVQSIQVVTTVQGQLATRRTQVQDRLAAIKAQRDDLLLH